MVYCTCLPEKAWGKCFIPHVGRACRTRPAMWDRLDRDGELALNEHALQALHDELFHFVGRQLHFRTWVMAHARLHHGQHLLG